MLTILFTLAIAGCYGNNLEKDYHIPDHQKVCMILFEPHPLLGYKTVKNK